MRQRTIQKRTLQVTKDYLSFEKQGFLYILERLMLEFNTECISQNGRPKSSMQDIVKSLLIMAYSGMSYRRCKSDLVFAKERGIISKVHAKATLCKYMNNISIRTYLGSLIQQSAIAFSSQEDTLIVDSTWFPTQMYNGGYDKKPKSRNTFIKTRKLHVALLSRSKMIAVALTSSGEKHDSLFFRSLLATALHNGFKIDTLLGDAGYLSKANYLFAEEMGVKNIFIDFRSNVTGRRGKSKSWARQFRMWKTDYDLWKDTYRYRVIIEGCFSALKRKFKNWLRMQKATSRDNEMLLNILVYNICVMVRYVPFNSYNEE